MPWHQSHNLIFIILTFLEYMHVDLAFVCYYKALTCTWINNPCFLHTFSYLGSFDIFSTMCKEDYGMCIHGYTIHFSRMCTWVLDSEHIQAGSLLIMLIQNTVAIYTPTPNIWEFSKSTSSLPPTMMKLHFAKPDEYEHISHSYPIMNEIAWCFIYWLAIRSFSSAKHFSLPFFLLLLLLVLFFF